MEDHPRLIEIAFPLKQTSLDPVHEEECAAWAHLHAAHLAGDAAAGDVLDAARSEGGKPAGGDRSASSADTGRVLELITIKD